MRLPGDEFVPAPTIASTHAITINKPAENIWPWIAQIGQDRGGFYSYTLLENLIGCRMKNADRIHSQWQNLGEEDAVQLHPKFPPMLVKKIETARHLVLFQQTNFVWIWAFVLKQLNDDQSRLLIRTRIFSDRLIVTLPLYPVMTLGHYFMERKMLMGIKRRSESN